MLARRTKTFVENAYWQRTPGGGPGSWRMLPRSDSGEVPLDQQIREWVEQTGAIIIHPGQLGMHTQWLDPALALRCVSLGLTVLYVERADYEQSKSQTTPGALPAADPDPDRTYRDDANAACAPHEFGEAALAAGDDAGRPSTRRHREARSRQQCLRRIYRSSSAVATASSPAPPAILPWQRAVADG